MFRIMQTSVVLAITLIMVNESQAGKPGTSSGNGARKPLPPRAIRTARAPGITRRTPQLRFLVRSRPPRARR